MRKKIIININKKSLLKALQNMFGIETAVYDVIYATENLQGGTVGTVCRINGNAIVDGGSTCPFALVLKEQKKWERGGDLDSWRREYDIYQKINDLNSVLPNNIRLPVCYYKEEFIKDETPVWQIYMEDVKGISGDKLTLEMLEYVMTELGKFQGYVYKNKPEVFKNMNCFGKRGFYNPEKIIFIYKEVADNINPFDCDMIPENLRNILTNKILNNIENNISTVNDLPKTLCHRDMWNANIFLLN